MGRYGIGRWRQSGAGQYWEIASVVGESIFWVVCAVHLQVWTRLLHFTWWGVLYHAATLVLSLFRLEDWNTDICIQTAVIAGVLYMSASACTMLVDSHDNMGTAEYAAGNFLVHYGPLVSAVARRHFGSESVPRPTAALLWLLYNALSLEEGISPSETYGCNAPYQLVMVIGLAAILISTFLFYEF